jgi:predicted PurR-regulated permease PerM
MNDSITTRNFYDIIIRLAFLALITAWCVLIILPFTSIILWSIILALALAPFHRTLSKILGAKPRLASFFIVLIGFATILVPTWLFFDSIIDGVKTMRNNFHAGILTIPPPSENVKTWPLVGNYIYTFWNDASQNLDKVIFQHKDQFIGVGKKIAEGLLSMGSGIFQLLLSLIIAGFLLVIPGIEKTVRKFFTKLAGKRGDEFADIANKTIGNVVKGVLGVAFIQSVFIGAGFFLANIPYAWLWTLIVFILAILQIPTAFITIPVIIFLFSTISTVPAILWSVYLFAGGISDNILKPLLLGKGAPVPMLVIFVGVLGGFILSGFIGLFTGAIMISLGYKLLAAWIDDDGLKNEQS